MKKIFAGILAGLALGAVTTVSALDMSAGLSGSFTGSFGGGSGDDWSATTLGGGFNAFFDITYAEIGVGMSFASRQPKYDGNDVGDSHSLMFLNLSAMGKYPFPLTDNMTLFPLVGVDIALGLSAKVDGDKIFVDNSPLGPGPWGDFGPIDYSQLWIKFGAGMDIDLTEKLYLRPAFQYGIGFALGDEFVKGDDANIDHGLTVKVGLGFKF